MSTGSPESAYQTGTPATTPSSSCFAVAVYKTLLGGAFGITDEALAQSAAQYKALLAE